MNLGKKVKVRDMKPGWTYRVPGKTLEEIYESAHEYAKWPPVQSKRLIFWYDKKIPDYFSVAGAP